jgi:GxxExxY protein
MQENELSYKIMGAAMELHKSLGSGLLESAYEAALSYDFRQMGIGVEAQVPMPLVYKEVKQGVGLICWLKTRWWLKSNLLKTWLPFIF